VTSQTLSALLASHTEGWESVWEEGVVMVEGEDEHLQRSVLAAQYYLHISLPFPKLSSRPLPDYCGLSPGGLANGLLGQDYQGHSFWDTESWMFPAILLLQPRAARALLDYRLNRLEAARDYAASTGWLGARFPWESAFTGGEVCPDWAAETRDNQHHITGDISFAIRQYLAVTGDTSVFSDSNANGSGTGCDLVREVAEFWISRTQLNTSTGFYDITGVMGPDEYHASTDNNVYTNVVAGLAIYLADYAHCVGGCPQLPPSWTQVAASLALEYSKLLDFHPQYRGYTPGTAIKQADTVLVGFPLMYPMERSTRNNDLITYEEVTDQTGPAMTWGMHAIGHLELGQEEEAGEMFYRSYLPYVQPPFYMWTEVAGGGGAVNFITGMGGFLQAVLYGYLGVRAHLDRMELAPKLPPACSKLTLTGLELHAARMDLIVTSNFLLIDVKDAGTGLEVAQEGGEEILVLVPQMINLTSLSPVSIRPLDVPYLDSCTLPADTIGNPTVLI